MNSRNCLHRFMFAAMLAFCFAVSATAQVTTIDPDTAPDGQDISSFYAGVTLTAAGSPDPAVYAYADNFPITGAHVFAWNNLGFLDGHWQRHDAPSFRADFLSPARQVFIDIETDGLFTLSAYDMNDVLLGSDSGQFGTLSVLAGGNDISHIVVTHGQGFGFDAGTLDHLVINYGKPLGVPEPGTWALLSACVPATLWLARRRIR